MFLAWRALDLRGTGGGLGDSVKTNSWERYRRRRAVITMLCSLQVKATLLVVGMTLCVTGGVATYLLDTTRKASRNEQDVQLINAASLLAKSVERSMLEDDLPALEDLVDAAANGSPLQYVVITDPGGRRVAQASNGKGKVSSVLNLPAEGRLPVPGRPAYVTAVDASRVLLDVTYPVTHRSDDGDMELLGYVRTGVIGDVWNQSLSSRLDILVGVGLVAMVLAIPLGFLLIRQIISPLDGLADLMRRFSRGGLDVRAPVRRSDEIGRLSNAFNYMADQHQQTHDRLVRLNAELEDRVAFRTHQLRELASREPLTGLYNRRHFSEVVERSFAEANRYQSDLSCIMIDLDEFKSANDEFGHQVGDELLILVAQTIKAQLRTADVAARYGGDEFIVLLPQTDGDRAAVLAERIVEQFAVDLQEGYPGVKVGMSVGLASLHAVDVDSADALMRAADRALYQAKAAGKNRIVVANESTSTSAS